MRWERALQKGISVLLKAFEFNADLIGREKISSTECTGKPHVIVSSPVIAF